jgi:hypothetical protein
MQMFQNRTARRGLDVLLRGAMLALLAWRVGRQAAAALGVGVPDSDAPALAVTRAGRRRGVSRRAARAVGAGELLIDRRGRVRPPASLDLGGEST